MLSSLVCLLATTTVAIAHTSPFFLLASSAKLPSQTSNYRGGFSADYVKRVFWDSVEKCPTTHYAVIVEPLTLSYPSDTVPTTPNIRSEYVAYDIDGKVNINHVLNIILMDCLQHKVLRVEELDPTAPLPKLDQETIRKSIMYAEMPRVDTTLSRTEYTALMKTRQQYTEQILEKYFDNEDYTLVYVREEVVPATYDASHEDGQEIPLVNDH